jgi:hypothetical protein
LALIAGTDSTRIELSRLGGTPAIIFVLDTKPVSLIKTYQQIKFLVRQTPAQECRLGVLFVTPTDRGSQRIGATCRRHLGIDVVDLGAVPETQWVSGVVPTAPDPILGPHPGEENPVATGRSTAWHQVVRRGLYGL